MDASTTAVHATTYPQLTYTYVPASSNSGSPSSSPSHRYTYDTGVNANAQVSARQLGSDNGQYTGVHNHSHGHAHLTNGAVVSNTATATPPPTSVTTPAQLLSAGYRASHSAAASGGSEARRHSSNDVHVHSHGYARSANANNGSGSELAHALRPSAQGNGRQRSSTLSTTNVSVNGLGYTQAHTLGNHHVNVTGPGSPQAQSLLSPLANGSSFSSASTYAQEATTYTTHVGVGSPVHQQYDTPSAASVTTPAWNAHIASSSFDANTDPPFFGSTSSGYGSGVKRESHQHVPSNQQAQSHPQLRLSLPSSDFSQNQIHPYGHATVQSQTQSPPLSAFFISPSPTTASVSPSIVALSPGAGTVSPHVLSLSSAATRTGARVAKVEVHDAIGDDMNGFETAPDAEIEAKPGEFTFVDDSAELALAYPDHCDGSSNAKFGATSPRAPSKSFTSSGNSTSNSANFGSGSGLPTLGRGEEEALAPRVRATYASAHMRRCMGLFRLNPFASSPAPLGSANAYTPASFENDFLSSPNLANGKAPGRRRKNRRGSPPALSDDELPLRIEQGDESLTYEGIRARAHTRAPKLFVHHMDAGGMLKEGEPPVEEGADSNAGSGVISGGDRSRPAESSPNATRTSKPVQARDGREMRGVREASTMVKKEREKDAWPLSLSNGHWPPTSASPPTPVLHSPPPMLSHNAASYPYEHGHGHGHAYGAAGTDAFGYDNDGSDSDPANGFSPYNNAHSHTTTNQVQSHAHSTHSQATYSPYSSHLDAVNPSGNASINTPSYAYPSAGRDAYTHAHASHSGPGQQPLPPAQTQTQTQSAGGNSIWSRANAGAGGSNVGGTGAHSGAGGFEGAWVRARG